MTKESKWKAALTRAALPGTETVRFAMSKPAPNEVSYSLKCIDSAGAAIGDDRDYDLLKAVMMPLENLSDGQAPFTAELNLTTDTFKLT